MDETVQRRREISQDIFERILEYYGQKEQALKGEEDSIQWAIAQQCLCYAYSMRRQGKQIDNLQQAIMRGQASLRILTRASQPVAWAAAHTYLGEAYRLGADYTCLQALYSGQAVMQEQALRHLEAALEVYRPHEYPLEWARVQHALSMSYFKRIRGKKEENLLCAAYYQENAHQVFACMLYPQEQILFSMPCVPCNKSILLSEK